MAPHGHSKLLGKRKSELSHQKTKRLSILKPVKIEPLIIMFTGNARVEVEYEEERDTRRKVLAS